jgi:uncharacterized protein involved in tolerance to divalent cations
VSRERESLHSVAWITAPEGEAAELAGKIVEAKLAGKILGCVILGIFRMSVICCFSCTQACVNLLPSITSVYQWKGTIERGKEVLMMVKTRTSLRQELIEFVQKTHSYETPGVDDSSSLCAAHMSCASISRGYFRGCHCRKPCLPFVDI